MADRVLIVIEVFRIQPSDGPLLRETRLAALLDTPSAFARTHAEEVGWPSSRWEDVARVRSVGHDEATFLARDEPMIGPAAGMVGAYRDTGDAALVNLVAMWVRPDRRGRGLGHRLVETVIEWAGIGDAQRVELWVTELNDDARRLYARSGFTVVGDQQPLPSDPSVLETRMRLEL